MRRRWAAALAGALLVTACSGGGDDAADDAPIEDTTSTSVYAAPVSADALVATETWGLVPADQVVVVLEAGADIEVVAGSLDARVVGEVPSIALFQLQTGGATATDLDEALATAAGLDGVELAFPNVQVVPLDACDPLADPAYEGSLGDPYRQIGLHGGWDVLRAAGIRPADVRVGVVDSRVTTATASSTARPPSCRSRPATSPPTRIPARTAPA